MASAMRVTARLRCAGLAFIRRGFSTAQLRHQHWSSATSQWHQNMDSTALETLKNGESFLPFNELILFHNFYSTDASATVQTLEETPAASGEDENSEEEDTLPELNKTNETPRKKKWNLEDARREICKVLNKDDEDMEETLTRLGVQITPPLVKNVMVKTSSPNSVLRFFQWAKLQPGFKHETSIYDELVNLFGRSKDFETLPMILAEMLSARCNYSVKTFSFATAWHDDSDMLKNLTEMFEKLEFSPKRNAYDMLIAALCEKNHANAALGILEKMASADCAPRAVTFRPLVTLFCMKNQLDKVQLVFEIMKMKGCPPDSITYNLVLSKLCYRKRLAEAVEVLRNMVDNGCKPDALTYDIMIYATCKTRRVEGALELFDRMKEEGIKPMYLTYGYLLNGIFEARGFDEAHAFLIQQSGTDPNLDSGNYEYLIRICHKSGLQKEVQKLLTEMKAKDLELLDDNLFEDILHENDVSQAT
jgi:pentatricopeptide repeat protein